MHWYFELIGYVGSALIVISLMMSAVIKLRIINLIGAATFGVYGLLIGAPPVVIMNTAIVIINSIHLYRMRNTREFFQLLQVPHDSPYLHYFLDFYQDQIRRFQPSFDFQANDQWVPVFILRNAVPAGLVVGTRVAPDRARILLDFAIPKYRDFKIAKFLFGVKREVFIENGIRIVESPSGNPVHNRYLELMGFQRDPEQSDLYVLDMGKAEHVA